MKKRSIRSLVIFALTIALVFTCFSTAFAEEVASTEPAADVALEEISVVEEPVADVGVEPVEEPTQAPELPVVTDVPEIATESNIPDIVEIKDLTETKKYSPEEIVKMEGASIAAITAIGGEGEAAPMGQASLDSVDMGSISNSLSASNPYDFLVFSFNTSKYFFFNFATSNSDYRATLCTVDPEGNIYLTNNVFSAGKNVVTLPANTSSRPMYCWLIQSTGSTGSSYTMTFNKSTGININPLYLSADYGLLYGNEGGTFYKNGTVMFSKSDSSLAWVRKMNRPQQQVVSGNVYGGYEKLEVEIYNAKSQRNSYGDMMAQGPYSYRGGGFNSSFVWLIPLDVGTGYMSWYTNYMPGPGGWNLSNNNDWWGNATPLTFTSDHVLGWDNYIVIDGNTGAVLDLYGQANTFYRVDLDTAPTVTKIN